MEQSISVQNITKNYGSFRAVDQLTFDVYRGEIFAMLGPNGAGKSTTIRMILDILRPDSGKILVLGQHIDDEVKNRIGYLPEERGLYRDVKVIDMMTYLGTLKGMSRQAAHKRSMALLEQLELAENANSKVKELSKGMQQKVQFAVTILHDPELIIVDEPFSGLDPVNTQLIKAMLLNLKDQGVSVVMSTHQMYQVEEMADRLLMINRGKQALYGAVDEVRRKYALHAIVVEGQGEWQTLPGVDYIKKENNSRNGQILYLKPDATPDAVLAAIAQSPNHHITRFEMAIPSLNDIFIQVAGERFEDVEAEYAQKEKTNV
ncbi:MAG: ATP-binding cassette domain-containing protein [Chloroflexi bacterium]|nr:MAG: ATP-binding cassette domain-containing protein [Chloroflexota bacterium]